MKKILVIDIPDEMCDDYDKWYLVSGDEIQLKYEEDGALMHYKNLGMDLELKPIPEKKEIKGDYYKQREIATELKELIDFDKGYNACIDEILEN